jgi:hypothetical protein
VFVVSSLGLRVLCWGFLGFLRFGCDSRSSGLSTAEIVLVACGRIQLLVTQEHLDLSEISAAAIEQMGGEAVAQRMHRHVFFDARRVGCFME